MTVPLMPLPAGPAATTASVRQRMDAAGCAFDFIVLGVPDAQAVTEAHHRWVLVTLFDGVLNADGDVSKAQPLHWDASAVRDASSFVPGQRIPFDRPWQTVSRFEQLFQAFDNPPYGADCPPGLFADFCDAVGLLPGQRIEVLDWAGDPDTEPHRSRWSSYFDAGRQWWGIWCLTVWNPRRRTLAALAASQTD